MKRPKNSLFAVLLLSVAAVVLAVTIRATREHRPAGPTPPAAVVQATSPAPVSGSVSPGGTPSTAAQRRAQEFNDATSRFNAPDDQPPH